MREILSLVTGLLFIAGFLPYVYAILKKAAKPSKASWVIWASLDSITCGAMYAEGAVNGQIVGATIGGWIVVVLALKYGSSKWTLLDKVCLGGAVLGIALWLFFDNPLLGLVTSLIVGIIGSIPTFASTWEDPLNEDKTTWTVWWISCVLAVATIPKWTFANAAQPITFFMIETIMVFLLYVRPRIMKS